MFQMHRIFCATPWEQEAERTRFHEMVGNFNDAAAMERGILFVPVTLSNIRDKRPVQYAVDENIRDCSYYILILSEGWGPPERNFRNDYHFALECAADPALPLQGIAVVARKQSFQASPGEAGPGEASPGEAAPAAGLPEPEATFATLAEFDACVTRLLSAWLQALVAASASKA